MIILQAIDPHWINGNLDDPEDQCLHGNVQFSIDSVIYVDKEDGEWTTSAAGLYLLRTVEFDHTREKSVAKDNYLIPCCGFSVWPADNDRYSCIIIGCNNGINPEVRHRSEKIELTLGDNKSVVDSREWAQAVLNFAQQIDSFYTQCSPKVPIEDDLDCQGWKAFWQEWQQRKMQIQHLLTS